MFRRALNVTVLKTIVKMAIILLNSLNQRDNFTIQHKARLAKHNSCYINHNRPTEYLTVIYYYSKGHRLVTSYWAIATVRHRLGNSHCSALNFRAHKKRTKPWPCVSVTTEYEIVVSSVCKKPRGRKLLVTVNESVDMHSRLS